MVDPIGSKPGPVVDRRAASVAAAEPTAPAKTVSNPPVETSAAQVAQSMAAQPPVDTDRVARIRKAVQEGRFPISPATIADRLIALKFDWNSHDAS